MMKALLLSAIISLSTLSGCAYTDMVLTPDLITPVTLGQAFHFSYFVVRNNFSSPDDDFFRTDSVVNIDTTIRGKQHCIAFKNETGINFLSYESDGDISILMDQGDKLWIKLPVSTLQTIVTDTIMVNPGTSDHWVFTAKYFSNVNDTVNGKALATNQVDLTWEAAEGNNTLIEVEKFIYRFAPSIGYFTMLSKEYLPVVNNGVDEQEFGLLTSWK
jgi:hypothetical protein